MAPNPTLTLLLPLMVSLFRPENVSSFIVVIAKTESAASFSRTFSKLHSQQKTNDASTGRPSSTNQGSRLTDWVIENLEDDTSKITSFSSTKAGENDTLPSQGLCMAGVRIMATDSLTKNDEFDDEYFPIRLLVGRNGWGTGVHPTTRLCLEWLSTSVQGGELVMDYGCGSGILSIAALHYGASKCIGVDVEAEALVTAERNIELNGLGSDGRFEGLHTREIVPYEFRTDICVANILIGQLVRPSMVSALVTNMAPGGLLCLSGIRPHQVNSLKEAYQEHVEEWVDYNELAAADTEGSINSYGFDVGRWSRLVGRIRKDRDRKGDVESMSELAVS